MSSPPYRNFVPARSTGLLSKGSLAASFCQEGGAENPAWGM
jgi:hypothetical protein